jgi:predicted transcriptional regulator
MNKENQKTALSFVKYYTGLSYLFNPAENQFIMHMVYVEYLKSVNYRIHWSKAEYIKRMGLKESAFNRCVNRLSQMKLLTRTYNDRGNRVYYSFDMERYNRLVEMLSITSNIDKLIAFCDENFKKQSRSIESITEDEINELKE